MIGYLRGHRITLTWDPAAEASQAATPEVICPELSGQLIYG